MSKWIKKDLFESFQKEKIDEKETPQGFNRSNLLWETPEKGTVEQAKIYEGRFVPDIKGEFYKRYFYHFWQSGETWNFVKCTKTPEDFKRYCPFCSAVSKLYGGTKQDKSHAYNLKRKERFVGNFFVAKDPRDEDRDEEKKVVGKIKLYEFPAAVEKKLKNEITDREQGYGVQIFDPSENGRNIIIKVTATKKMDDGRQWPDYSNSTFSRSQSAIANTEEEIDKLMSTCTNLVDYIDSMETPKEKMIEILKSEFLWELVEDECVKYGFEDVEESGNESEKKSVKKEEKKTEESFDTGKKEEKKKEQKKKPEPEPEPESTNLDDVDDDDLLRELDNM